MKHQYIFVALAVAATACSGPNLELPTSGRVYRESMSNGDLSLLPVGGVEVIVERINVCAKSVWTMGEASTTGIDSFIVTTDSAGYFRVPRRSFSPVCSYVVLSGKAILPYMQSISAAVAKNPVVGNLKIYESLGDADVVIKEGKKGVGRVQELVGYLNNATGSHVVSETNRKEVYSRYFQEICELHEEFPKESAALYENTVVNIERQCE